MIKHHEFVFRLLDDAVEKEKNDSPDNYITLITVYLEHYWLLINSLENFLILSEF